MITEMPKINPAGRFSTTATAFILGIERTTLWYASKKKKIKYHVRESNGRRFYTGTDIMKYFNSEMQRKGPTK